MRSAYNTQVFCVAWCVHENAFAVIFFLVWLTLSMGQWQPPLRSGFISSSVITKTPFSIATSIQWCCCFTKRNEENSFTEYHYAGMRFVENRQQKASEKYNNMYDTAEKSICASNVRASNCLHRNTMQVIIGHCLPASKWIGHCKT